MGRGRSGPLITSPRKRRVTTKGHWGCSPGASPPKEKIIVTTQDVEVAKSLTKEQLAYMPFKENESEATQCLKVQPSTPRERSQIQISQIDLGRELFFV